MAAFLTGIVLGLALLTRGTLVLTVPLLALLTPRRKWTPLACGCALVIIPWIIRNAVVFGALIPFSTGGGRVLYGANNPYNPPGSWQRPLAFPNWERFARLSEVEQDRAFSAAALTYLQTETPAQLAARAASKWRVLLGDRGVLVPVLVCAIASRHLRRRLVWSRALMLCCAFWAGLALNTALFWGDARFLFPVWSTVAIAAALILKAA